MGKTTKSYSVPPDDPMFSGGPQLFRPYKPKLSEQPQRPSREALEIAEPSKQAKEILARMWVMRVKRLADEAKKPT
jgi:hypothetical protein